MTKLKDPIRQASLFTMAGLADPRLATDHSSQKTTGKVKNTRQSVNEFRKYWEELTGRKLTGHQA